MKVKKKTTNPNAQNDGFASHKNVSYGFGSVHSFKAILIPRRARLDCGFLLREGSKELDAMRLTLLGPATSPLLWQSPIKNVRFLPVSMGSEVDFLFWKVATLES